MRKIAFCSILLVSALMLTSCGKNISKTTVFKDEPFQGNPPICPRWAIEPWVWEDNGNTQASTIKLVDDYMSRNIPVGVVIVDSPWSTAYNDYEFDLKRFPNPKEMIDQFHSKNVRVILWMTGLVNNESKDVPLPKNPAYDEVIQKGYTVNNGMNLTWWKGKGVHIEFTNPEATNWWHQQMDKVLDLGIDGWKVDDGDEYVPDPTITSLGSIKKEVFKRYYYADIIDYSKSKREDMIISARPY